MSVDREELKRLAEAATPGPWTFGGSSFVPGRHLVWGPDGDELAQCRGNLGLDDGYTSEAVAEYVAAVSPDVVLSLLAELEQLEASLTVPESYYGVVSGAVAEELERAKAELHAARAELDRLRREVAEYQAGGEEVKRILEDNGRLRTALAELVFLKEIKERIESGASSADEAKYYAGHKDAAWHRARRALGKEE